MTCKRLLLPVFLLLGLASAHAQVLGGGYALPWLSSAPSAQATALGGWQIRFDGRDPALVNFNPAALNVNTVKVVHASQDFLKAGAGRSIVAAAYQLDKFDGIGGVSVQYVGYGDFSGIDERGNATGTFKAGEYAIGAAFAKTLDERLHLGAQINLVGGSIESYNSMGATFSAGLMYVPDTAQNTVVAVQLQHAGYLWNAYTDERSRLPWNLSAGVSRRLRYLPLRVGALYRRLDRWDLLYDDPERRESDAFTGGLESERGRASKFIDNFARHLSFNGELYIGKTEVIQLRFGYDHQRQREAKVAEFRNMGGFTYGFGLNLRKFRLDYGHGIQHLAGGPHYVGLLVDFGQ